MPVPSSGFVRHPAAHRAMSTSDTSRPAPAARPLAEPAQIFRTPSADALVVLVSHELKNPLGVVRMGAALLGERARAGACWSAEDTETLHAVARAAARMERLIRGLLDSAAVQADDGEGAGPAGQVALGPLLADVWEAVAPGARARRVLLEPPWPDFPAACGTGARCPGEAGGAHDAGTAGTRPGDTVTSTRPHAARVGAPADRSMGVRRPDAAWSGASLAVDPVRATQVLVNLLENATQHAPRGSRVAVRVVACPHARGPGVRIVVADRGPGLAVAQAAEVFAPFRRGAAAPRGGHGLGLAIARALAEADGGSVGVDARPGGGCRFWVTYPAVVATESGAGRRRPPRG